MREKDASVTIWIDDGYENINLGMTFPEADGLTFYQYLDVCRRAATVYGFSSNLINAYFPEEYD